MEEAGRDAARKQAATFADIFEAMLAAAPPSEDKSCNLKQMNEALRAKLHIPGLVNRFLAWKLPEGVCVDMCAAHPESRGGAFQRTGTNLLTYIEARLMFEHVLDLTAPFTTGGAGK